MNAVTRPANQDGYYQNQFSFPNFESGRTSAVVGLALSAVLGVSVVCGGNFTSATTGNAPGLLVGKRSTITLITGDAGVLKVRSEDVPALGVPDWRADLEWIKDEADVTISALAGLFGVTRRSFYGWLAGVTPKRGGSQLRIAALKDVMETLPSASLRSALFARLDEMVDGETFRVAFQSPADVFDEFRGRLDGVVEKLKPALERYVERAGKRTSGSRAYETDYPSV